MNRNQTASSIRFINRAALGAASAAALVIMASSVEIGTARDSTVWALSTSIDTRDTSPYPAATDNAVPEQESEGPTGTATAAAEQENGEPANTDGAAPEQKGEDEAIEIERLKQLASEGDRDAALALAKRYVLGDEPDYDAAANYAIIALADGGETYAAEFIPNTNAWPRKFWRALQTKLQEQGAYRGAIDGLPGNGTRRAVKTYADVKAPVVKSVRKKPARRKKIRRGSHTD